MCKGGGHAPPPPNFENFKSIYVIILMFSNFSLKNKSWLPQILNLVQ